MIFELSKVLYEIGILRTNAFKRRSEESGREWAAKQFPVATTILYWVRAHGLDRRYAVRMEEFWGFIYHIRRY